MPRLLFFAAAREAAGLGAMDVTATTVSEAIGEAVARLPDSFGMVLPSCRVWLNGEPTDGHERCGEADEIAFIPPVSGGSL
ncbi:MAG: MoaD/ThiS family protein [Acidimicrobiaceae bacterium]|nr:MoaD/ThiS family protein [Acidimicrobiaceae bacterium]